MQERVLIFGGNYGSGKTEIALNTALALAKKEQVTLVDLDIVNPYFRSSEQGEMLRQAGVRLITPTFAGKLDVPALPAEVDGVLGGEGRVVIDVGGDSSGAVALGRYAPRLRLESKRVFMVINANRPFSGNAAHLAQSMRKMEGRMRLPYEALINNTNLGPESTQENLLWGQDIIKEFSRQEGKPIDFIAGTAKTLAGLQLQGEIPLLPLRIFTRPDWL